MTLAKVELVPSELQHLLVQQCWLLAGNGGMDPCISPNVNPNDALDSMLPSIPSFPTINHPVEKFESAFRWVFWVFGLREDIMHHLNAQRHGDLQCLSGPLENPGIPLSTEEDRLFKHHRWRRIRP